MERKEVEALVTDLTMLIEALPACSTIEPVALKAQTSAGVYETSYTRDCVDNMTSEYLDIFFKDHESHISVIADSRAVTLEVIPDHTLDYEGDRLITIPRNEVPSHEDMIGLSILERL